MFATELRSQINRLLEQSEFQKHIKEAIGNNVGPAIGNGTEKTVLLSKLREAGIVDKIISELSKVSETNEFHPLISELRNDVSFHSERTYLNFELLRGRAFLDNLTDDSEGEICNKSGLVFYLAMKNERFQTSKIPCYVNININQAFLFDLDMKADKTAKPLTFETLLADKETNCLIELVCVRFQKDGHRSLVSSVLLDWKKHIFMGGNFPKVINVELPSIGSGGQLTAGVLEIRQSLVWPSSGDKKGQDERSLLPLVAENLVKAHFALEEAGREERSRSFALYSKKWWNDFCSLQRGQFQHRMVKMFAMDERGIPQFASKFVNILSADRLICSVQEAARFISCIPSSHWIAIGVPHQDIWLSGLSVVSRNRGSAVDHSNLFCSLLRGFGLNAYVAVGTKADDRTTQMPESGLSFTEHKPAYSTWVIVLDDSSPNEPVVWNSFANNPVWLKRRIVENLTRENSGRLPIKAKDSVDCLYNEKEFYANIQQTGNVFKMSFNLKDSRSWYEFSPKMIALIRTDGDLGLQGLKHPCKRADLERLSELLECELRKAVTDWRRQQLLANTQDSDQGLIYSPLWDEQLCTLLGPMLSNFEKKESNENAALTSVTHRFDECEFNFVSSAIRNYVSPGYTFKAYPLQNLHSDASRIFISAIQSPLCRDIFTCTQADLRFGLRVQIFNYAEDVSTTWCIFGCIHKS